MEIRQTEPTLEQVKAARTQQVLDALERPLPQPGERWRHVKGTIYEVVGFGRHTESQDDFVIYRKTDDAGAQIWIRPHFMFMDRHSSGAWRFERVPVPAVVPLSSLPPRSRTTDMA